VDRLPLRLAYSPCPNDTYVFHAWVHGLVPGAPPVEEMLEDIDTLNGLALRGEPDVAKVSIHAFAHLRNTYALLHSGGALGRGCGPLVVARKDSWLRPATSVLRVAALVDHLDRARVAIPGELTTAALLLGLFTGGIAGSGGTSDTVIMPFDRIMPAVASGEVDAGVIIHEGRFTYGSYGLRRLADLGEWWEETTGLPIPLGGIAVSRTLDRPVQEAVDHAVRASLEHAWSHPAASLEYVSAHAQEMDPAVCQAHIELYVNDFTREYGPEGEEAIRRLLETAAELGLVPFSSHRLFWDE
jgi:1,4-dihydroxy-6-naphthoate synthase